MQSKTLELSQFFRPLSQFHYGHNVFYEPESAAVNMKMHDRSSREPQDGQIYVEI
jgi:hypothetical protein